MRGKAPEGIHTQINVRITPAHAGKSSKEKRLQTKKKDHPRTCGEKIAEFRKTRLFQGSPPHMRGKDTESLNIL